MGEGGFGRVYKGTIPATGQVIIIIIIISIEFLIST